MMIYTETRLKKGLKKEDLLKFKSELETKLFRLQMESNRMRNTTWLGNVPPWRAYDNEIHEVESLLNQIEKIIEKK